MNNDYSYTNAGFDDFLCRSIDGAQMTLDAPGPVSTQINLDGSSISGVAGDIFQTTNTRQQGNLSGDTILEGTLTVGSILIDGREGNIKLPKNDPNIKQIIIGAYPDGNGGILIAKSNRSIESIFNG